MRRMPTQSMRRATGWLVAIATMATVTLALAAPAHAAVTVIITVTCPAPGNQLVLDKYDLVVGVGDTIRIANTAGAGITVAVANGSGISPVSNPNIPNGSYSSNFTVTASTGGFDVAAAAGCVGTALAPVTFSPGSSSSSTPAPVMQQFGKPTSGTCEAAAPVTLNWGGAGSDGWGESWAQWMNGGNGGAVCTRTLVYSDNLGSWTVG